MKRKILPKQKMDRTPRENGDATLARIIDAAGRLFAERGYAETMNKDIAKLAKVSLTSINYHFGSREVLYETVIRKVYDDFLAEPFLARLQDDGIPAWERVMGIIEYMTRSEESGWQGKFWVRELLMPSSLWAKISEEHLMPAFRAMLDVLGEATGIPADSPELEVCLYGILTPSLLMFIANPQRRKIGKPAEAIDAAQISGCLKEFVLAGVEKMAKSHQRQRNLPMAPPPS